MAQYSNTLGVFAAYTTVNHQGSETAAPVVAAVIRDLKQYMQLRNDATSQRILPVGYGASTTNDRDRALLQYLSAGDRKLCIDFWTASTTVNKINLKYLTKLQCTSLLLSDKSETEWHSELVSCKPVCGLCNNPDNWRQANRYQDANLPIFFSEYPYGRRPRYFNETTALFSSPMINEFSGGCVYEFWQGVNDYGLVKPQTTRDGAATADEEQPPHVVRRTDHGTLLIFNEFEHYKAKIRSTKDVDVSPSFSAVPERGATDMPADVRSRFEASGQIPDTCIDWAQLGGGNLRSTG
jgi:1,3-beta-glucanosyltransferase GAS5